MICDKTLPARFISDQLGQSEVTQFELHLETCEECRASLDSLASNPQQWQATCEVLGSSADVPNWESVAHAQSETGRLRPHDLSLLAPTDHPDSMGRIGNFEVLGVIGRGGMGIVFKAFDRTLNRNIALKVLDPALADVATARQRFNSEVRAMAAISHEHVVPIYAVDTHSGLPYFAMEYVSGGTLEARLNRDGALSVLAIVQIAYQAASALAAAHTRGLVHRDIKPANILLDSGTERVRVADFGLARVVNDASHTRSGFVAGTPQYMSPEQIRGQECDARSDLFSLGTMMYAMCVGHSPFRAESMYGSMQRIVHDAPRSIRTQNAEVPVWLERFIFKLLEKQPERRFESAELIVELLGKELQCMQNSHAVQMPERTWMRSHRFTRRVSAAVVAVAALFIGWFTISGGNLLQHSPGQSTSVENTEPQSEDVLAEAQAANANPSSNDSVLPSATQQDYSWETPIDVEAIESGIQAVQQRLYQDSKSNVDSWDADVSRIQSNIQTIQKSDF